MITSLKNKLNLDDLSYQEVVVVCLLFGTVVLAWTLDSFLNPVIRSSDLNAVAAIVAKDMDSTLYPYDNLLARPELYNFYTPFYRWVTAQAWTLTGSFEAALIWLVPPVLSAYLVAMFVLLRYVTKNGWIALGLTVASAHYQFTMGGGVWGAGGSVEMSARTIFLPAALFLMLLFLKILDSPTWHKGLLFGVLFGLAANMHPISGFHLLALLSALLILVHGNRFRGWLVLFMISVGVIIGAWPFVSHYNADTQNSLGDEVTFAVFSEIVAWYRQMPFNPNTFEWPLFDLRLVRPTLDVLVWFYLIFSLVSLAFYIWGRQRWPNLVHWAWLVGGLITLAYAHMMALFHMTILFVIVVFYIIYRFSQKKYSILDGWLITLTGLIVLYSFVGYYLLMYVWQLFEVWPLTSLLIQYARAARFIYLPIYLLAGLGGVTLIDLLQEALKRRFTSVSSHHDKTVITSIVALIFGVAPAALGGAHRSLSLTLIVIAILLFVSVTLFVILTRLTWSQGGYYLSAAALVLILFGPFAPFLSGYLPLPAKNLLNPNSWQVDEIPKVEANLYDWVVQNTARDALIYSCFDHKTLTYFRRVTQRNLTHNWKDLGYAIHNGAVLVPDYNKFRTFQRACSNFDALIASVHQTNADFLLVNSNIAAEFLSTACFANERFALFAVNQNSCLKTE